MYHFHPERRADRSQLGVGIINDQLTRMLGAKVDLEDLESAIKIRNKADQNIFHCLPKTKDIILPEYIYKKIRKFLIAQPTLIAKLDMEGNSPLALAAVSRRDDLFLTYLACVKIAKIEINSLPKTKIKGFTILHLTCANDESPSYCLNLLDAFPDINVNALTEDGLSPLVIGLSTGIDQYILKTLVKMGASLDKGTPTALEKLAKMKSDFDLDIAKYKAEGRTDKIAKMQAHPLNPNTIERILLEEQTARLAALVSPTGLMPNWRADSRIDPRTGIRIDQECRNAIRILRAQYSWPYVPTGVAALARLLDKKTDILAEAHEITRIALARVSLKRTETTQRGYQQIFELSKPKPSTDAIKSASLGR